MRQDRRFSTFTSLFITPMARVGTRGMALAILLLVIAGAGGCANSAKFSDMKLPPIAAGQGRMIIYRDGFPLGFAVQPDVKVNDQFVGKSVPNNFFFVDRPAGHYKVSCLTEWQHDTGVDLPANQVVYVQTHIAPGVVVGHVWPEVVEPSKALPVLKDCTYNGTSLTGPPVTQPATTQSGH